MSHRGGIGRRVGLKIQFSLESVGSIPTGGIHTLCIVHSVFFLFLSRMLYNDYMIIKYDRGYFYDWQKLYSSSSRGYY